VGESPHSLGLGKEIASIGGQMDRVAQHTWAKLTDFCVRLYRSGLTATVSRSTDLREMLLQVFGAENVRLNC